MEDKLSINSDIFVEMRDQFNVALRSLVTLVEASDEAELTLKIRLRKGYIDVGTPDLKETLKASWDITRIIKAKKHKVSGLVIDDYVVETDTDGNVVVSKVQTSLFDENLDSDFDFALAESDSDI